MTWPVDIRRNGRRGFYKRSAEEQVALVVSILDGCHDQWVIDVIVEVFGKARANRVANPVDLSRNTLAAYVDRINKVFVGPTFIDDLSEGLALLLGDQSARVTVEAYAAAGGRPMPTPLAQAAHEAERYRQGAGYAGLLLGWSKRAKRISTTTISPDMLELVYTDDDPTEPTIIRQLGTRTKSDGKPLPVVEEYDLTDLSTPFYRILHEGKDITSEVLGQTFVGDDYLAVWSYQSDDRPYHPIVITGDNRHPFGTRSLVEATLMVAARWSAWGVGTDHASHPQRHVRGLALDSEDSDASTGQTGIPTGPEYVYVWRDLDPQKPGDHWQDAPAFDPLTNAKAIRTYEGSAMSAMGIPVDMESTGGEPTKTEQDAVNELIQGTYPEARRFTSELLRRSAALANRLPDSMVPGADFKETPYGALFREEVREALNATNTDNGPEEE